MRVGVRGAWWCGVFALVGAGCLAWADPFQEGAGPLPVDEAFAFTSWLDGENLVAHWTMPEGYYLYLHGFEVRAGEGVTLGAPAIPPGEPKTDPHFGDCEVHYGSVAIRVPIVQRPAAVAARITYQGCADTGLCYPPRVRAVKHDVADDDDGSRNRGAPDDPAEPAAPVGASS